MSTKNNPGKFDCYAAAGPDEPMFILLGRDKHAPTLIWLWATLRELDSEEPEKVEEARQLVTDICKWQVANGKQAVGLGHSALAAVMELIRAANQAAAAFRGKDADNTKTGSEYMRAVLAKTTFEDGSV